MRVENGRGHKSRRFAARIAKHNTLIARAFVLVARGIDADRDIDRLRVNIILYIRPLPMKPFLRIADFTNGVSRGFFHILGGDRRRSANFPGKNNAIGRRQRFHRNAAVRICL